MTIYGVSQTSGVERLLQVERGGEGVVLTITEHVGGQERERIVVPADSLLATVMDRPPSGITIEGVSPRQGAQMLLDIAIHRNEVKLRIRGVSGSSCDVAVGLDDFQDALEGAVAPG